MSSCSVLRAIVFGIRANTRSFHCDILYTRFHGGRVPLCPLSRHICRTTPLHKRYKRKWKLCEVRQKRKMRLPFLIQTSFTKDFFSIFSGKIVVIGNFSAINEQCKEYRQWDKHFINFALFLTLVDYIGVVAFCFYSGYTLCDNEEEE